MTVNNQDGPETLTLEETIIRKATLDDITQLIDLLYEFYKETGFYDKYRFHFDTHSAYMELSGIIKCGNVFLVAEQEAGDGNKQIVGMLAGILTPTLTHRGQLLLKETSWYVKPEHRNGIGDALRIRFEEEGKKAGAICSVVSSTVTNEDGGRSNVLDRYYRNKGYEPLHRYYIKDLR